MKNKQKLSYSLLVQHYVKEHGGKIVQGTWAQWPLYTKVDVIIRVHETDKITADNDTIIFDPWRTYPKADNVIHYGK